eukprot:TRINITY_DN326_c4_g1_i4.p1 TRINITY_DN326_c4_g1~~TRINITY_DN326_c4_g1_i4.p1  ORF type:complete len:606 (+),score=104.78 TRINITY_DN326_c4_g1_i4:78-1895(+)
MIRGSLMRRLALGAQRASYSTAPPQNSNEEHKAGWDPEERYEVGHPFYDPYYSDAIFEFEFEEGFIDNQAFMRPSDKYEAVVFFLPPIVLPFLKTKTKATTTMSSFVLRMMLLLQVVMVVVGNNSSRSVFGDCDLAKIAADVSPDDACEYESYAKKTLIPGATLCVIGLLVFLFCCPIFYIARFCCDCCGSSKIGPDAVCCPTQQVSNPDSAYSDSHIKKSKLVVLVPLLFALLSLPLVMIGNNKGMDAFDVWYEHEVRTITDINTDLNTYVQCMTTPEGPLSPDAEDKAVKAQEDLTSELEKINDQKKDAEPYSDLRWDVTLALGVLPIVLAIAATIFAFANVRNCLPMTVTFFSFFLVFILFLILGVHVCIYLAIQDLCYEVDEEVAGKPNLLGSEYIAQCDKQGVTEATNAAQDAINQLDSELLTRCQSLLTGSCVNGDMVCVNLKCDSADGFRSALNSSSVINVVKNIGSCTPGDCSIDSCSTECDADSSVQQESDLLATLSWKSAQATTCYNNLPATTCLGLMDVYLTPLFVDECDELRTSLKLLVSGMTFSVLALILLIPVNAHGSKTWRKPIYTSKDDFHYGDVELQNNHLEDNLVAE